MVSLGSPLAHGPRAETQATRAARADRRQVVLGRGGCRGSQARQPRLRRQACATPIGLVQALERRKPVPPDVELFHFLTSGLEPLWVERQSSYRHRCFFVGSDVRALVHSGQAEYVPISLTQIPHLTANGRIRTDVAFVQVSPPDDARLRQSRHLGRHRNECPALRQNDRRRSQSLHATDARRYVPSR